MTYADELPSKGNDQAMTIREPRCIELVDVTIIGAEEPPLPVAQPAKKSYKTHFIVVTTLLVVLAAVGVVIALFVFTKEEDSNDDGSTKDIATFRYTGFPQEYLVPVGVAALHVTVCGASGGTCYKPSSSSGGGGCIETIIPASYSGQKLHVYVGANGDMSGGNIGGAPGFVSSIGKVFFCVFLS